MAYRRAVKIRKGKLTAYNRWGYLFVAPFVIVFLIFSVYPVLRTLYLSFTDLKVTGTPHWLGLANYKRVFSDKFFWKALGNTMRIWVVNIVLQLGLAFLLMVIFSDVKYKMKGLRGFRIIYYLPNLIAATSIAFLFSTFFMFPYGDFNNMISAVYSVFGKAFQRKDWLGSSDSAGYVIAIIQSWVWFGNSFLMLMAGVQGISKDYFEAASIDGAGRWTIFAKITLPLIRPILMYVAITSLIGGVQMFDLPYLMISPSTASYGRVQTAMMYLYKFGFTTGTTQTGYASSIAYTMFLIILAASIVEFRLFNRKKED
ncbi:MAG: sugar ABC transporter permease [Lachnospiraceae bacterium]|nr:sugar ABC transporter permease [Lachnospiraceae bacterium]